MKMPLQKIVLVGRDAPVWIAALALQRALSERGTQVVVLELATSLLVSDVYTAVPAVASLHQLLQLDHDKVVAACDGVPMLGQRFSNWGGAAPSFMHGYDVEDPGDPVFGFVNHWLKATSAGLTVAYDDFSLAVAAAKQNRVTARQPAETGVYPLPGYQFDAVPYAGLMKHFALRFGVEHRTGAVATIERTGDCIAAVNWSSEERFEADLFIDVSGDQAALIGEAPGADWLSWSAWLPCDRLLSGTAPRLRPLPGFSQISAFRGGWVALQPLCSRTAVSAAFSSKHVERSMLENLPVIAGVAVKGEAVITPFEPGTRRHWVGNCVALGAAGVSLEPLDGIPLHILHLGLTHLLTRLVEGDDPSSAAAGFNQAISAHGASLRDFQIAHYRLNGRFDEPFWDDARDAAGPASLDRRLAQFRSRGSVPLSEGETFQQSNWLAILIGHGLLPATNEPWVDQISDEKLKTIIQDRLSVVADRVRTMPFVEDEVRQIAGPASPALWEVGDGR